MLLFSLFSTSLLIYVSATNDWNKPCTNGTCSYNLKQSHDLGTVEGAMKLWSENPNAITDITPAAGWSIMDCDTNKLEQEIRVVCAEHASECEHLFNGDTAEDKIVRLPEECGKNAFARISRSWVHDNQTMPDHIIKRLVRRDGKLPEVKGLQLDTDFKAISSSKYGDVNFNITGTNSPNFNYTTPPSDDPNILDPSHTVSSSDKTKSGNDQKGSSGTPTYNHRRFDIGKAIGDATSKVGEVTQDAKSLATQIAGGATSVEGQVISGAANAATGIASTVVTAEASATSIAADVVDKFTKGMNSSHTFGPFDQEQNFTLADFEIPNCQWSTNQAKISVFAHAKAHMEGSVWVSASGIANEGKVGTFSMGASFSGEFDTLIWLQAQATGEIDTGRHTVISIGLPGLDFPGIFQAGPAFTVDAQASLDLDISTDLSFGMKHQVNNAGVLFPPKDGQSQPPNSLEPDQQPLQLSNSQITEGTAKVTGYLTPALTVGVSAFGSGAQVYLSVDGQVNATLRMDSQKLNGTEASGSSSNTNDSTGTSDSTADSSGSDSDTMDVNPPASSAAAERRRDFPLPTPTSAATRKSFSRFFDRNVIRELADSQPDSAQASADPDSQTDPGDSTDEPDSSSADAQPSQADSADPSQESSDPGVEGDPSTTDGSDPSQGPNQDPNQNPSSDPTTTDPAEDSTQSGDSTSDQNQSNGQQSSNSTQPQFGGCLDIGASISVNAGAQANFFGLFDKDTHVALWSIDFGYFYHKCFGSQASIDAVQSQDQAVQSREVALGSRSPRTSLLEIEHKRLIQPQSMQKIACSAMNSVHQASLISDNPKPAKHK